MLFPTIKHRETSAVLQTNNLLYPILRNAAKLLEVIEEALDKVERFAAMPIDGVLGFFVVPSGNDHLYTGFLNGMTSLPSS